MRKKQLTSSQRTREFLRQRQREQEIAERARTEEAAGIGPLAKALSRRNQRASGASACAEEG